MKHIWKSALALLLALGMTAGAFGCGSKKDAEEKSTSIACVVCAVRAELHNNMKQKDCANRNFIKLLF